MNYYLFLDESGDHGLVKIDEEFPVFVLTGVVISHENYIHLGNRIKQLKERLWPGKTIIFHSTDIRKWQKGFEVLMNTDVRQDFYLSLNEIVEEGEFEVIASAIRKEAYIQRYGLLVDDVYEVALSHVLERTFYCLRSKNNQNIKLRMHIEKRGKKEDRKLATHIQKVFDRGTFYVSSERFKLMQPSFRFHPKSEGIIGLELADLAAYPIARHVLNPDAANPPFDIIRQKLYQNDNAVYGLKIHP